MTTLITHARRSAPWTVMDVAKRVQRKRAKGWKAPEGAVYVGRGTRWGNPWRVTAGNDSVGGRCIVGNLESNLPFTAHYDRFAASQRAVAIYRDHLERGDAQMPTVAEVRAELAGKDLMCWCPPGLPCHVDVLLEIANGGDPHE